MQATQLWSEQAFCCPNVSSVCAQDHPKVQIGELPAGTCRPDQVAMAVSSHEATAPAFVCVPRSDYMDAQAVFPYDPLRKSLICGGAGSEPN
jgi:hypothetical protein